MCDFEDLHRERVLCDDGTCLKLVNVRFLSALAVVVYNTRGASVNRCASPAGVGKTGTWFGVASVLALLLARVH